jgi:murein L,D-transpeptidase YcbB/YkuD
MIRPIPVFRFAACAAFAALLAHSAAAAENLEPAAISKPFPDFKLAYATSEGTALADTGLEPAVLSPLAAAIQSAAEGRTRFNNAVDKKLFSAVRAYYAQANYDPAWMKDGKPSAQARAMVERIAKARYDGLKASDYKLPALYRLRKSDPERAAEADVAFSFQVARFITHLAAGRVAPRTVSGTITQTPQKPDVGDILTRLAHDEDIGRTVRQFEPPHPQYWALKERLAEMPADTDVESVPEIANGRSLRVGLRDPRVAALRARLDIPAEADGDPRHFDKNLKEAVKAYQSDNDLHADGIVGPRTRSMLNGTSRQSEVATLIANLERWRWMPRDLGDFNVMVNVPEFRLRVNSDGQSVHETKVIVGTAKNPTPVFSDEIEHIVVNPYWNVPASILREEMLPSAQRDPYYFTDNGYQVLAQVRGRTRIVDPWSVDWFYVNPATIRIRQPPGDGNALGRVKFLFPNRHAVYLHDTPSKSLFKRSSRAFSHGCVRVQNPMKFADALLANEPELDANALRAKFGGKEQWVNLETHIPVHLTYFRARVEADGSLTRITDIYKYDTKLRRLMGI